jgi:hypothetical protein
MMICLSDKFSLKLKNIREDTFSNAFIEGRINGRRLFNQYKTKFK